MNVLNQHTLCGFNFFQHFARKLIWFEKQTYLNFYLGTTGNLRYCPWGFLKTLSLIENYWIKVMASKNRANISQMFSSIFLGQMFII